MHPLQVYKTHLDYGQTSMIPPTGILQKWSSKLLFLIAKEICFMLPLYTAAESEMKNRKLQ